MKAIIYTQYGPPDFLQFAETPKPAPKNNEILIKIRAVSINAADSHLMRADPFPVRFAFGLFKPKIQTLGADIAGQVEAAALLMASITALQGLRDLAKIKAGQKVLIYSSNRLQRDERIGRVGQGQTYNRQTLSAA